MNVGALLVIVIMVGLLGGWVVVTNSEMTTFTLGAGLHWSVPIWLLALGGFAAGALFVLLLNLGSLAAGRSEVSAAARALEHLAKRVSDIEGQLGALSKPEPGPAAQEEETKPLSG
jgi:uncharacterized integral membrane protein